MNEQIPGETEAVQALRIADLQAQLRAERIARVAIIDALVNKIVDNVGLAAQVDQLSARVGELVDENQLLRDDAEHAPVPFTISQGVTVTSGHLTAVPDQRTAGTES